MSTTRILEGFKGSVFSVAHCISGSIVGITWADLRSCCDGLTRLLRWEALNLVATRSTTSKADRRRRTIGGGGSRSSMKSVVASYRPSLGVFIPRGSYLLGQCSLDAADQGPGESPVPESGVRGLGRFYSRRTFFPPHPAD